MLQSYTRTHAPSVEVKQRLIPVPEVVCSINEDPEKIRKNIRVNIKRGLPQVEPYETQDKVIGLAVGGVTLEETFPDLLEKKKNGMPVIAVNGSHEYCVRNGLSPSAMVMLDSREFNSRFIYPILDNCKYFISSQCHPSVFEKLEVGLRLIDRKQVWIWHCAGDTDNEDLLKEQYGDNYFPVMGGSTVTLRAIHLFRMLGFSKFEVYGFDSCIIGQHHAYEQKENDGEQVIDVVVADKEFKCTAAHYHQAQEFVQMTGKTGEFYDLAVHGDGLIAHIIKNPDSLCKSINKKRKGEVN
jgi:hypothetical protein